MDSVLHANEERQLRPLTAAFTVVGRRAIVGRRRIIVGRGTRSDYGAGTRFIMPFAEPTIRAAKRRAIQGGTAALMETEARPSRYTPSPTIAGCQLGRLVATAICRWEAVSLHFPNKSLFSK